jgi:hypothetical protein
MNGSVGELRYDSLRNFTDSIGILRGLLGCIVEIVQCTQAFRSDEFIAILQ